jgi:hypothetical protein
MGRTKGKKTGMGRGTKKHYKEIWETHERLRKELEKDVRDNIGRGYYYRKLSEIYYKHPNTIQRILNTIQAHPEIIADI